MIVSTGWFAPPNRKSSVWPIRIALVANLAMLATASQLPPAWAPPYWLITWLPIAAFTWSAVIWFVLAHIKGLTPRLAPQLMLPLATALVVGAVGASTLTLPPNWTVSSAMTDVGDTAVHPLGAGHGRAIRVTGLGATASLGATHTTSGRGPSPKALSTGGPRPLQKAPSTSTSPTVRTRIPRVGFQHPQN